MRQELFVYWHVAAEQLDAAVAATQAWQESLRRQQPGLTVALYRRVDDNGLRCTLMETYAAPAGLGRPAGPGGIDGPLAQTIALQADAVTAPYRQGPRHTEVFEALS